MAADNTAADVSTQTLVAATNASVSITGSGRVVELVHHNDTTDVVYFKSYSTEPVDDLTGSGADDEEVLLPGERLTVHCARGSGEPIWIELISAGTPTVSVVRRRVNSA